MSERKEPDFAQLRVPDSPQLDTDEEEEEEHVEEHKAPPPPPATRAARGRGRGRSTAVGAAPARARRAPRARARAGESEEEEGADSPYTPTPAGGRGKVSVRSKRAAASASKKAAEKKAPSTRGKRKAAASPEREEESEHEPGAAEEGEEGTEFKTSFGFGSMLSPHPPLDFSLSSPEPEESAGAEPMATRLLKLVDDLKTSEVKRQTKRQKLKKAYADMTKKQLEHLQSHSDELAKELIRDMEKFESTNRRNTTQLMQALGGWGQSLSTLHQSYSGDMERLSREFTRTLERHARKMAESRTGAVSSSVLKEHQRKLKAEADTFLARTMELVNKVESVEPTLLVIS